MSTPDREEVVRVTTLELFFDLVFVFTLTQLTEVLVEEPSWRGVLQVVLMLAVIWWIYAGYAWMTNAVALDYVGRRVLLLGGMAGFLVGALAVPHAFEDTGTAFALAYLAVVLVHAGLFTRANRAILGLAPYNLAAGLLLLAGGLAGGTTQYVLWALAALLEWTTPRFAPPTGFQINCSHFVERHGLVVLIAIGESVVAIGIGAAGLELDAQLVGVAILGLLLNGCLWWAYFGGDDERAERALSAAPPGLRPLLAVRAYGHWHLPILLGIIAIAAALKEATAHPFDALEVAPALELAGGVALFLIGEAVFRHTLAIGAGRWRAAAAVLALATLPLGWGVAAALQVAVVVVLLAAALALEPAAARARLLATAD